MPANNNTITITELCRSIIGRFISTNAIFRDDRYRHVCNCIARCTVAEYRLLAPSLRNANNDWSLDKKKKKKEKRIQNTASWYYDTIGALIRLRLCTPIRCFRCAVTKVLRTSLFHRFSFFEQYTHICIWTPVSKIPPIYDTHC